MTSTSTSYIQIFANNFISNVLKRDAISCTRKFYMLSHEKLEELNQLIKKTDIMNTSIKNLNYITRRATYLGNRYEDAYDDYQSDKYYQIYYDIDLNIKRTKFILQNFLKINQKELDAIINSNKDKTLNQLLIIYNVPNDLSEVLGDQDGFYYEINKSVLLPNYNGVPQVMYNKIQDETINPNPNDQPRQFQHYRLNDPLDEQDFDFDDDEIDSQGDIDDEDYIDYGNDDD